MPKKAKPFPLLTAAAIKRMATERRRHFVNKNVLRLNKSLGDAVGMTEMGVHLVRIKQGDDTTEFHTHYCDEEFVYILSGHGLAEIGKRKIKVGPGDFMGFTAQSLPPESTEGTIWLASPSSRMVNLPPPNCLYAMADEKTAEPAREVDTRVQSAMVLTLGEATMKPVARPELMA